MAMLGGGSSQLPAPGGSPDACYKSAASKKWEAIELEDWRGSEQQSKGPQLKDCDDTYYLIKEEKIPDGTVNREELPTEGPSWYL